MTKVKLRTKPISDKRQTLYLDIYPPVPNPETGKPTRRNFLGLYIFDKAKSSTDKLHNKETLALAENIRARRQIEIQNGQYGFLSDQMRNADFVSYFRELVKKRSGSNHDNWISALYYLEKFTGGKLLFSNMNEMICDEFREYLITAESKRSDKRTLSQNSVYGYFGKFKAALKQAYKDGYLQTDLNSRIEGIRQAETNRQFLTLEELQSLVKADCKFPVLKRAALFSAITGMRFSDIQKLLWSEVQYSEDGGYYLQFRQQKTSGVEVLPISEQAFKLMGNKGEPTDKVFTGLVYSAYMNVYLKRWILNAGITKEITFHSFRHTFATLQLLKGTDIYTVSKMLGHRELKTTQIYAKIIDETKRAAAERIKLEM